MEWWRKLQRRYAGKPSEFPMQKMRRKGKPGHSQKHQRGLCGDFIVLISHPLFFGKMSAIYCNISQVWKHHLGCGCNGPRRTIYLLAAVQICCLKVSLFGNQMPCLVASCKSSWPRSHDVSWLVFLPATWQSFGRKSLTHLDLNLTGHTNITWIQYTLSTLGQ